jgi:hypothetical protein
MSQPRLFGPPRPAAGLGIPRVDASGFIATASDAVVIHADNIARGFGAAYAPAPEVATALLARPLPWAPASYDPLPDPAVGQWPDSSPGAPLARSRLALALCALAEWDGPIPVWAGQSIHLQGVLVTRATQLPEPAR